MGEIMGIENQYMVTTMAALFMGLSLIVILMMFVAMVVVLLAFQTIFLKITLSIFKLKTPLKNVVKIPLITYGALTIFALVVNLVIQFTGTGVSLWLLLFKAYIDPLLYYPLASLVMWRTLKISIIRSMLISLLSLIISVLFIIAIILIIAIVIAILISGHSTF